MATVTTIVRAVYAAMEGFSYTNGKIGQTDGTKAGTKPVIALPGSYTDPRVNSFIAGGAVKVELCNRGGSPGQAGTGSHHILGVPLPSNITPLQGGLGLVANAYATVAYGNFLAFMDFDHPAIQVADMTTWTIIQFGDDEDQPAFAYSSSSAVSCGMSLAFRLETVDNVADTPVFYALFSNGDSYGGPWQASAVVRLRLHSDGHLDRIAGSADVEVGRNSTGMVLANYTPDGQAAEKWYLLISAIGGVQSAGAGNGVNSVIAVVETGAGFHKLANAVNGTFAIELVPLDLKGLAVTPTVNQGGQPKLAYVYIMGASYSPNWATYWTVRQATLGQIIEKALAMEGDDPDDPQVVPYNLGDFLEVAGYSIGAPGYFWGVGFSADAPGGIAGKLIIGYGTDPGDELSGFDVSSTGVDVGSREEIDYSYLYGGTGGSLLNTFTVFGKVVSVSGATSYHTQTLRAAMPHPVANGEMALEEFEAQYGRGAKK